MEEPLVRSIGDYTKFLTCFLNAQKSWVEPAYFIDRPQRDSIGRPQRNSNGEILLPSLNHLPYLLFLVLERACERYCNGFNPTKSKERMGFIESWIEALRVIGFEDRYKEFRKGLRTQKSEPYQYPEKWCIRAEDGIKRFFQELLSNPDWREYTEIDNAEILFRDQGRLSQASYRIIVSDIELALDAGRRNDKAAYKKLLGVEKDTPNLLFYWFDREREEHKEVLASPYIQALWLQLAYIALQMMRDDLESSDTNTSHHWIRFVLALLFQFGIASPFADTLIVRLSEAVNHYSLHVDLRNILEEQSGEHDRRFIQVFAPQDHRPGWLESNYDHWRSWLRGKLYGVRLGAEYLQVSSDLKKPQRKIIVLEKDINKHVSLEDGIVREATQVYTKTYSRALEEGLEHVTWVRTISRKRPRRYDSTSAHERIIHFQVLPKPNFTVTKSEREELSHVNPDKIRHISTFSPPIPAGYRLVTVRSAVNTHQFVTREQMEASGRTLNHFVTEIINRLETGLFIYRLRLPSWYPLNKPHISGIKKSGHFFISALKSERPESEQQNAWYVTDDLERWFFDQAQMMVLRLPHEIILELIVERPKKACYRIAWAAPSEEVLRESYQKWRWSANSP